MTNNFENCITIWVAIKLLEKSLTEIFLRKNDNLGNNSRYFKQLIN